MKDQMHNVRIDANSLVSEEKISEANHSNNFICSGELAKFLYLKCCHGQEEI